MSDLTCPHCRNLVPRGATVCRGCQAELKYGAPNGAFGVALLAGVFAGVVVDKALPPSASIAGWIVGAAIFFGLSGVVRKIYANRVIFKRIYRTR
ncbi:hypothetical protein [Paraburkholderia kururiensis]|uniref:hypothetical protein n=1 Tax=Paraburkholderia kururiensis TaxID=984307 RepID=UPI0018F64188|nr:hypothetical protein [Paraburkholderia kururiensis]